LTARRLAAGLPTGAARPKMPTPAARITSQTAMAG